MNCENNAPSRLEYSSAVPVSYTHLDVYKRQFQHIDKAVAPFDTGVEVYSLLKTWLMPD